MQMKLEIKNCDYDLISSAFEQMIIPTKLEEVSHILDSFIMIGLDCLISVKREALVQLYIFNVTSDQFDQIKNILQKEGIKYALFN